MFKTTLDQWIVFKTVAEQKGFSAAAEVLNRSQSTISYSMSKLQSQIGVQLVYMEGKKCELTSSGKLLLQTVKTIINDFDYLETVAQGISKGIEANLTLSIDTLFPRELLFDAIASFGKQFPATEVFIDEHLRLMPSDKREYDLSISTSEHGLIPGPKLLDVPLIPVAHREHPIFTANIPYDSVEDIAAHKQIFYKRSLGTELETMPSTPNKMWTVDSLESAIAAIRANLCYGWLPKHHVESIIAQGEVQILSFENPPVCEVPLYLVEKNLVARGPAARCLAGLIRERCERALREERNKYAS